MPSTDSPSTRQTVICLKWGNRYGPEYVNRLAAAVWRHTKSPVTVVCFTDDAEGIDPSVVVHPIPEIDLPPAVKVTPWRKLCLFRPDLPIEGLALFLDLDLVITGPLDDFFTFGDEDDVPIIHNWVPLYKRIFRPDPQIGNSSIFRFKLNHSTYVWDQFHREKEWALANFRPPQTYLTHCIRSRMKYWPDHWVRSFKRHCRPGFPLNFLLTPKNFPDAKVIVFHGRPDPDEAAVGYRGSHLNHYSRPAPWVNEHWR